MFLIIYFYFILQQNKPPPSPQTTTTSNIVRILLMFANLALLRKRSLFSFNGFCARTFYFFIHLKWCFNKEKKQIEKQIDNTGWQRCLNIQVSGYFL